MTLQDIKSKLGYPEFKLNTANDKDGNPTLWFRHWDNDNRIAVSVHSDLAKELEEDDSTNDLALQTTTRTSNAGGNYVAHRIVRYAAAEMTL